MTHYDVFNGDADGICALHQLRLVHPVDSVLVSGPKRDIALLERVPAQPGDALTVLDVSLAVNRIALLRLLDRGVRVEYFDHHFTGELPSHPQLSVVIDTSPEVCTAILVDRYLNGRQRIWAVVGAFGDNLTAEARVLARSLALDEAQLAALQELGENLAYNGYGDAIEDLIVAPDLLYRAVHRHDDPFDLIRDEPILRSIGESRRDDLERARGCMPEIALPGSAVFILPEANWSRRVRGVFANELARESPRRAHAILTPDSLGGYNVSVRAPLERRTGADALCRRFPSGNGRAAAAGINHLPAERVAAFTAALREAYP